LRTVRFGSKANLALQDTIKIFINYVRGARYNDPCNNWWGGKSKLASASLRATGYNIDQQFERWTGKEITMAEKSIGAESMDATPPQQSGKTKNLVPESKEMTGTEAVLRQSSASSILSEADRSMVDQIVQSSLLGLYRTPSSHIRSILSIPFHSGIVDSSGNPVDAVSAQDAAAGLIGESQEDLNIIALPASDFEKLSAKTAEILREADLAYERITKDQEETERLKTETREILARLRAA
jgi:hypothetical protein